MRFQVRKSVLFVVGGLFWIAGGTLVIRTGLRFLLAGSRSLPIALGTLATFCFFFFFIFRRLADRHLKRIVSNGRERLHIVETFDVRTYLIMVVMSGGGTLLRRFGLLPDAFIASFYPGLGTALLLRGIDYIVRGLRRLDERKDAKANTEAKAKTGSRTEAETGAQAAAAAETGAQAAAGAVTGVEAEAAAEKNADKDAGTETGAAAHAWPADEAPAATVPSKERKVTDRAISGQARRR